MFVGHCDSLSTPRPLGPIRDIQAQIGSGLSEIDEYRTQHDLFEDMLRMLNRRPAPVIVAIEDGHWADQATLDALAYLGRRITETAGLVVMTYRDDEAPPELERLLGLASSFRGFERITVEPLSMEATALLARGAPLDPGQLFSLTRGNPFFVTEVLGDPSSEIPPSVVDAVRLRASGLSAPSRRILGCASVVPTAVEW